MSSTYDQTDSEATIIAFPLGGRDRYQPETHESIGKESLQQVLAYSDWWHRVTYTAAALAQTMLAPAVEADDQHVRIAAYVRHLDAVAAREELSHHGHRPTFWVPVHLWGEIVNEYRTDRGLVGVDVPTLQGISAFALKTPLFLNGFRSIDKGYGAEDRGLSLLVSLVMGPVWEGLDGDVLQYPHSHFENHLALAGSETLSWTTEELLRASAAVLAGMSNWAATLTEKPATETLTMIQDAMGELALNAAVQAGHPLSVGQLAEEATRAESEIDALA